MELIQVTKEMYATAKRIDKATRTIYTLALAKAETEKIYRKELSKEMINLRENGVQATLIPDIARGNAAFLRYERDLARDVYNSANASLRGLQTEASLLQTISKYHEVL